MISLTIELVLKFMNTQYNNHGNSFRFRLHRYVKHKPVFMCISQKHNVVGSNTVVSINLFKISHCILFVLFHPAEYSFLLLLRVTLKPVIDCGLFKSHECNIHDVKPRLYQLKFGISLLLILQISCASVHACNDHRSYTFTVRSCLSLFSQLGVIFTRVNSDFEVS